MPLSQQQIRTAAKWWADRLRQPKFSTLSQAERDTNPRGAMAEIAAEMFHKDPGADSAARFEEALITRIEQSAHVEYRGLHVDYQPDAVLSDALEDAGLTSNINTLPWKTDMHFAAGSVRVSYGCGAPYEDIPLTAE